MKTFALAIVVTLLSALDVAIAQENLDCFVDGKKSCVFHYTECLSATDCNIHGQACGVRISGVEVNGLPVNLDYDYPKPARDGYEDVVPPPYFPQSFCGTRQWCQCTMIFEPGHIQTSCDLTGEPENFYVDNWHAGGDQCYGCNPYDPYGCN